MSSSSGSSQLSQTMELPPIRSLNDFLLESARFQLPNFNDFDKWGNRVVKNLLYYQTNYFLIFILFFSLMSILYPIKIISGFIYIGVLFIVGVKYNPVASNIKSTKNSSNSASSKQQHLLIVGGIFIGGFLFLYIIEGILIVAFTFLVPFCATFIHSSLRLRNIKNKVVNTIENLGLRNTPMGIFLDSMSLSADIL